MTNMKNIKDKLIGICILLVVFFIGFILIETYFRLFNPQIRSFLQPDPVIGTKHIPNLTLKENNSCIQAVSRFNNEGMRDIDHTIEKPEGTYRIAVIGDSYVEAMQVNLEDTFFSQLASNLQNKGKNVEVLSFGVGGFGTAQEYLLLRDYALKYSPDLVIVSFFSANDIRNNSYALEKNSDMPYAHLNENGTVEFDDFKISEDYLRKYNSPLRTLVFDNLHTARFLYRLSSKSMLYRNLLAKLSLHTEAKGTEDSTDSDAIYFGNWPEEWEKSWDLTQALILEMKKESEKHGADFMIFSLSNPEQISTELFEKVKEIHPKIELNKYEPEKRLADFLDEKSIKHFSVLLYMERLADSGITVHVPCHGHWSKEANHLAGKALAKYILKNVIE